MTNATCTPTTEISNEAVRPDGHDWRLAGEAWGHAADDWSTLFEHYAAGAVASIATGVGAGLIIQRGLKQLPNPLGQIRGFGRPRFRCLPSGAFVFG